MRISKHLYFEFIWCFLSLIIGYDRFTQLQSLRGNKNRQCSTWHWNPAQNWVQSPVLLHILGPVSFLCLALFPGYHLVSLFSKSPSLLRLFLSPLSVLLPTAAKQKGCVFPLKSHLTCDLCFFGLKQDEVLLCWEMHIHQIRHFFGQSYSWLYLSAHQK